MDPRSLARPMQRLSLATGIPRSNLYHYLKNKAHPAVLDDVKEVHADASRQGSTRMGQAASLSQREQTLSRSDMRTCKMRGFRAANRPIVYLDETWLNTNHVFRGEWSENLPSATSALEPPCGDCGRVVPSGKGSRMIILDVCSKKEGLIPGCSLVFASKNKSQEYHDEMNSKHFIEWFRDTLIPKLEPSSVIVMNNAPYHSHLEPCTRVPTSATRKAEIQAWLDRNVIHYDSTMIKAELLQLVRQNKPQPTYVTDELAKRHGHKVLRLPPYHCELNPIELIWAQLKNFVGRNNSTYKKCDIINLFNRARSTINRVEWTKVEAKPWDISGIQDADVPPVIISMDSDSEDSGSDSDCHCQGGNESGDDCDDTDGSHVDVDLCSICHLTDPPDSTEINTRWFECESCLEWCRDKCCKEG